MPKLHSTVIFLAFLGTSLLTGCNSETDVTAKAQKISKPSLQVTLKTVSGKQLIQLATIELEVNQAFIAFDKDGDFKDIKSPRGETLVRAGDEFTKRGTTSPTMTLVGALSQGFAAGRPGIQASMDENTAHSNWPNTIFDKEREEHIVQINEDGGMVPEGFVESLPEFEFKPIKIPGVSNEDSRSTEIAESDEEGEIDPQKLIDILRGQTVNPGHEPASESIGTISGPVGPGTFDPATDEDDAADEDGIIDPDKLKDIQPGVIVDVR